MLTRRDRETETKNNVTECRRDMGKGTEREMASILGPVKTEKK